MKLTCVVAGLLLSSMLVGCGFSAAQRDAGELREVALAPAEAIAAAKTAMGDLGYAIESAGTGTVAGRLVRVDKGQRAASIAAGVIATPFAFAVDVVAGGQMPVFSALTVGLAVHGGRYDTQIAVQAVELESGRSAVRATAVHNGRLNPNCKQLAAFWTELGGRTEVFAPTDAAKAALPPMPEARPGSGLAPAHPHDVEPVPDAMRPLTAPAPKAATPVSAAPPPIVQDSGSNDLLSAPPKDAPR